MRKLKLDLDGLVVEAFEPAARPGDQNGTVRAHESYPETGDPRQRICYTPYYECDTRGWTCFIC